jgi:hypothetical protein
MDDITRQFLVLIEKIRKDLREAFSKQTDAISQNTKAAENKQNNLPVPLPVLAELQIPEADKRERRDQHEQNRCLQIWLTVGTWLAFLAAAIYAGETSCIVRTTNHTYEEMHKQTTAAQQSAEAAIAAQRPWLKFDLELAVPLTHIPSGYDFAVTPRVKNVGKSVANNVSMKIEHRVVAQDDSFKIAAGYKDWCENTKPNVSGLETYFPDENKEDSGPWHMNVSQADMQKGAIINGKVRFIVLVYGCLSYKFEGSTNLHRTGIVYQLSAKQNNLPYLLKPDGMYTINDLIFGHFPFAWEYAN